MIAWSAGLDIVQQFPKRMNSAKVCLLIYHSYFKNRFPGWMSHSTLCNTVMHMIKIRQFFFFIFSWLTYISRFALLVSGNSWLNIYFLLLRESLHLSGSANLLLWLEWQVCALTGFPHLHFCRSLETFFFNSRSIIIDECVAENQNREGKYPPILEWPMKCCREGQGL